MSVSRKLAKLAGWCRWHEVDDLNGVTLWSVTLSVLVHDEATFVRLSGHPNASPVVRDHAIGEFTLDGIRVRWVFTCELTKRAPNSPGFIEENALIVRATPTARKGAYVGLAALIYYVREACLMFPAFREELEEMISLLPSKPTTEVTP